MRQGDRKNRYGAPYTTLLFDLDNTLLDFSLAERKAIGEVFRFFGLEDSEAALAHYSRVNDSFWKAFERGEIPAQTIYTGRFERFLSESGQTGNPEAINERYLHTLGGYAIKMPGCDETLRWLQQRGYSMVAVTNGIAVNQHRRVKEAGLDRCLSGLYISEEIGFQKPDPAFFDCVFQSLPEKELRRLLIIGDSMTSDMEGGMRAGLDTCYLSPDAAGGAFKPTFIIRKLTDLKTIL